MTAYPDPIDFADLTTESFPARSNQDPMSMRPNVTEHFLGYEVRPNEQIVDIAVLLRATSRFLTVATLIAALGVWLLPATVFGVQASVAKMTVSLLLICASLILARGAARGPAFGSRWTPQQVKCAKSSMACFRATSCWYIAGLMQSTPWTSLPRVPVRRSGRFRSASKGSVLCLWATGCRC
jgi:hypothetical protein